MHTHMHPNHPCLLMICTMLLCMPQLHSSTPCLGTAGYDGSAVKQLSLRELELLHRLSFGHRNQRSYLVVLYKPGCPACQAFEAEVGS